MVAPAPAASEVPAPVKPVSSVPVAATPSALRLGPLQYIRQTLNNCGPASIAEVLKYWGVNQTQDQAQALLRPDGNSRGMMPYPVPSYIHSLGMSSLMGVGGNDTLVKALVANGFPVIIAQAVSATDRTGHYREIEGFDDGKGVFISTDSYLGPNHEIGYAEFNQIWTGNQRFMVVYPPAKQTLLDAVTASVNWDKTAAYQADLARPQRQRPGETPPSGVGRDGFTNLNTAWDLIQLGRFDEAKAEIARVSASANSLPGGNSLMLKWLNQALATAQA